MLQSELGRSTGRGSIRETGRYDAMPGAADLAHLQCTGRGRRRDSTTTKGATVSDSGARNRSTLDRRDVLILSASAGVGVALGGGAAHAAGSTQGAAQRDRAAGSCSTPRSAVARTQYGTVRGYVDDGVLTFKGVPYGASTGGENRWLPAKPPVPWNGEYPALTYGPNCPQRLHDWSSEQTFLQQWTDGWQSEDMLKLNVWTSSLSGKRPVMVYLHGGGYSFGSAYELAAQDGAQLARHHDVVSVTVNHRLNVLGFFDVSSIGGSAYADSMNVGMTDLVAALALGSGQRRELRWRSELRDDLRPVGRRLEGDHAARDALGGGPDPSRVGAVGRRRQSPRRRAVQRVRPARDRRARRHGHRRAAEAGVGQAQRGRQWRSRPG